MFRLSFRDHSFDAVELAEALKSVPNPDNVFSEISRVPDHGGRLHLTRPNPFALYRYLRHYLLKPNLDHDNYLGADGYCKFIDPLSLVALLRPNRYEVTTLTFRNVSIPGLPTLPDWSFLHVPPFNRAGSYTCVIEALIDDQV